MESTTNVLEIKALVKDFPGVRAVDNVSFNIKQNTVHCLVGENGAGKSTLIKIITGAYKRTSGTIHLNGELYEANNTREAKQKGISTLFQELNVVEQLTVEENLTLGIEKTKFGFIQKCKMLKKMIEVMNDLEPSINPCQLISTLSVAKRQIVEIVRAVATESDIIIMDEPTAAISEGEIKRLFKIIRKLRENNVTVIYITHRLDEVFELGDYVTVMRDGKHVVTKPISDVNGRSELIKMMIGKTVFEQYVPRDADCDDCLLEAKNLTNNKLKDISFSAHRGEIVGFYGLVGAGKTELARAIYGVDDYKGEVVFKGQVLTRSPEKSIAAGIAFVPEERRTEGLFTILTIQNNVPVMNLKKISRNGFIDSIKERAVAQDYIQSLNISTPSARKETSKLSGGNQQKVVLSKCLFADADLLLMDEPTRGIDVGAKSEIYSLVRKISKEGKTVFIFSSELPEIVNLCDSIYLLYDGEIKSMLRNSCDVNCEEILSIATGGAS